MGIVLHADTKGPGMGKNIGWEALWKHRLHRLLLNIYVDDYKASGKATSLPKAWAEMREAGLELDEPTSFTDSVYLGQRQHAIEPPLDLIREKAEVYRGLLIRGSFDATDTSKIPNHR